MTVDAALDAAMGRALELAAEAATWGDTPIGAVVLGPSGQLLAEAANEREKAGDPTAHAEVLALRAAARVHGDGWRLTGATLVVAGHLLQWPVLATALAAAAVCFGLRLTAIRRGWSLPVSRSVASEDD